MVAREMLNSRYVSIVEWERLVEVVLALCTDLARIGALVSNAKVKEVKIIAVQTWFGCQADLILSSPVLACTTKTLGTLIS